MLLPGGMVFASLLAVAAATSNADLASWYATRTLAGNLAEMQPEVVAKLLSQVEQKWGDMAVADLRNRTEPGVSLASMKESCAKVTNAIVKGSDGDKDRVAVYLEDVCGRASSEGVPMCKSFATVLGAHLSHDVYSNREELDAGGFCADFYNGAVKKNAKERAAALDAAEKARAEKAKAEAEAKAKADEELAQRRAQAEADARHAEANRLAAKAAEKLQQAEQTMTQAEKRADTIIKGSKDATDTADQARKEVEVAAEKEAQAAEKQAAEAQERVKALRLAKAEEAKRSAEEKVKAEAQKIVDEEKKAQSERKTTEVQNKAEIETTAEVAKDANVVKKTVLIKKSTHAKATVKRTLRAQK